MSATFDPRNVMWDPNQSIFTLIKSYMNALVDLINQDEQAAKEFMHIVTSVDDCSRALNRRLWAMTQATMDFNGFYIRIHDSADDSGNPTATLSLAVSYRSDLMQKPGDIVPRDEQLIPIGIFVRGDLHSVAAQRCALGARPFVDLVSHCRSHLAHIPFKDLPGAIYQPGGAVADKAIEVSRNLNKYLVSVSPDRQQAVGAALMQLFCHSTYLGITARQMLNPDWRQTMTG